MNIFNPNTWFKRESTSDSQKTIQSGAQVRVNRVYASTNNCMNVAAFFHAIDLRAKTSAKAQLKLQTFDRARKVWGDDIKYVTSAEYLRRLNYLLTVKPNRLMNARQMWQRVSVMRDLLGCAGIYLTRFGGEIQEAWPVRVNFTGDDQFVNVTSDDMHTSWVNVDVNDVLLLHGPTDAYDYHGTSLTKRLEQALSLDLTAEAFALEVMAKGGTFKAIVKQEGTVDPLAAVRGYNDQEVKENVESIEDQFRNGKDLVYDPSAVQLFQIQQSFQDLQVNLIRNSVTESVARVCQVPLPLMFYSTNAVYKSIDDAFHTFVELTIKPLLEEVEQELNSKVLTYDDYGYMRFKFDCECLCLDSDNTKAQAAATRKNAGITTANEERRKLGMEAHPEGDNIQPTKEPTQTLPKGGVSDTTDTEN